jgi:hypothetical protein
VSGTRPGLFVIVRLQEKWKEDKEKEEEKKREEKEKDRILT